MTAAPFVIFCDTREKQPPPFPTGVVLVRVTMAEGDYTTERLQGVAAIERSRAGELAGKMTYARERVDDEVRRLMNYWRRCLVVEGEIGEVSRSSAIHPNSVIGSIASWYARSDMPVLFAGTAQGAGRLIAGVLKRWEERLAAEGSAGK